MTFYLKPSQTSLPQAAERQSILHSAACCGLISHKRLLQEPPQPVKVNNQESLLCVCLSIKSNDLQRKVNAQKTGHESNLALIVLFNKADQSAA